MPHASDQVDIDVSINGHVIKTYLQDSYDSLRSIMNHDTYYMAYEEGGPMQIALKFPGTFDWLNADALKIVIDIDHLHLEEHTVIRKDLEHAEHGVEILRLCGPKGFDAKHKSKSSIELQHSLPPFRYKRHWYGNQSGQGTHTRDPGYIDRIENTRHPNDRLDIKGSTLLIHMFRAYCNNGDTETSIPVTPSSMRGNLHKPFGLILQSTTLDEIAEALAKAHRLRKNRTKKSRSTREQEPFAIDNEISVWDDFWQAYRKKHICLEYGDHWARSVNDMWNMGYEEEIPEFKLPDTKHDHEHAFEKFKRANVLPESYTLYLDSDDGDNVAESPPSSPIRLSTPTAPFMSDQTRTRPLGYVGKAFAGRLAMRPKNDTPEDADQTPAVKRKPSSSDSHANKAFAHRPKTAEHETRRPEKKRKQSSAKSSDDEEE